MGEIKDFIETTSEQMVERVNRPSAGKTVDAVLEANAALALVQAVKQLKVKRQQLKRHTAEINLLREQVDGGAKSLKVSEDLRRQAEESWAKSLEKIDGLQDTEAVDRINFLGQSLVEANSRVLEAEGRYDEKSREYFNAVRRYEKQQVEIEEHVKSIEGLQHALYDSQLEIRQLKNRILELEHENEGYSEDVVKGCVCPKCIECRKKSRREVFERYCSKCHEYDDDCKCGQPEVIAEVHVT